MIKIHAETSVKIIFLILVQVFLFTGSAYPESPADKNISSSYIYDNTLRAPLMSGRDNSEKHLDYTKLTDESDKKNLYMRVAREVQRVLRNTGSFCLRHSAAVAEKLFNEYGIRAVIMGEDIGKGVHYWVQTEDGFIVDAFPSGRGTDLVKAAQEGIGNGTEVVINKNNPSMAEKRIIDGFYRNGVMQYALNSRLLSEELRDAFPVQQSI
jgi:hypothetical protein